MSTSSSFSGFIVVIGASAGGVEALSTLVASLPADINAPVLITHHQAPQSQSMMPAILSRAGVLPARHALNNQPLEPSVIYVAPPDRHMLVKEGRILLGLGPRENCTRPAIDPLFRTAAVAYGARVISVILTGNLDDGTAGMATVKECGGIAIAQEPREAPYPSMPESAIHNVKVDYVLPVSEIGAKIVSLTTLPIPKTTDPVCHNSAPSNNGNTDPAEGVSSATTDTQGWGAPSMYTCPDCHGTLWESENPSGILRFRCRVGNAYSSSSLAAQQGDKVEEALWTALRALEERSGLAERLAARARTKQGEHRPTLSGAETGTGCPGGFAAGDRPARPD